MAYRSDNASGAGRALRLLALIFIVWVAFWASTGGLARLLADDTTSSLLTRIV